ncbi:MAG: hypothetical protein HC763_25985, partial [Hydrococcus sp. CRU_1_1]|nr:hypothetical protein [Hydrococcus sp. CRU_1_1]
QSVNLKAFCIDNNITIEGDRRSKQTFIDAIELWHLESLIEADEIPLPDSSNSSIEQKAVIAVEAEHVYNAIADAAKERQRESIKNRDEQGRALPVVQKIAQLDNNEPQERTREKVARTFGTNKTYVSKAKKVKEFAPELLDEVKSGSIALNAASRLDRTESLNGCGFHLVAKIFLLFLAVFIGFAIASIEAILKIVSSFKRPRQADFYQQVKDLMSIEQPSLTFFENQLFCNYEKA